MPTTLDDRLEARRQARLATAGQKPEGPRERRLRLLTSCDADITAINRALGYLPDPDDPVPAA